MIKNEIQSLTALRGIAALLIVIHHMTLLMLPFRGTAYAEPFGHMGLLGMSLFFCLSGFVIFYNYSDTVLATNGCRKFISARVSRLMPLYVVFVVFNFIINIKLMGVANKDAFINALPLNLLAAQSWFYGRVNGLPLESSQLYANVAWSISTELMLYMLFIPFAFIVSKFNPGVVRGFVIFAVGIAGRCIFVYISSEEFSSIVHDTEFSHWLIYTSPYGRWFEFMAGIGIADLWSTGFLKNKFFKFMSLGALVLASMSIFMINGTSYGGIFAGDMVYIMYAIFVPFVIVFFCTAEEKHKFEYGPLLFVGELSYSIYLIHADLFPLFRTGWGQAATNTVSFLVAVSLISYVTHKYIEIPGKKVLYKKLMTHDRPV